MTASIFRAWKEITLLLIFQIFSSSGCLLRTIFNDQIHFFQGFLVITYRVHFFVPSALTKPS